MSPADGLPAQLAYVEKGLAPVSLAQPTYLWGHVSVQRIFDKVQLKQDVPTIIPMELVRVTKDNLGTGRVSSVTGVLQTFLKRTWRCRSRATDHTDNTDRVQTGCSGPACRAPLLGVIRAIRGFYPHRPCASRGW